MTAPVPEFETLVAGLTADQRLELGHYLLAAEDLTDVARVNRMLGRDETDVDPDVVEMVEAANSIVPTWVDRPSGGWKAHQKVGASMLAARLYRRKDSPGGMAAFGAEGGGYVSGNWPDIAMLLGLGTYAVGRVG